MMHGQQNVRLLYRRHLAKVRIFCSKLSYICRKMCNCYCFFFVFTTGHITKS